MPPTIESIKKSIMDAQADIVTESKKALRKVTERRRLACVDAISELNRNMDDILQVVPCLNSDPSRIQKVHEQFEDLSASLAGLVALAGDEVAEQ